MLTVIPASAGDAIESERMAKMSGRNLPPFWADHVGSLLRPRELLVARERAAEGLLSHDELRRTEDRCILEAVHRQEEIGLKAVTDGEFRRAFFHIDFLVRIGRIRERRDPKIDPSFKFKGTDFRPPVLEVHDPVRHIEAILGPDFDYLKSIARVTPKITVPSPSTAHFRGGRDLISKAAYPDLDSFFTDLTAAYRAEIGDLAARGCRYIQIDEVDFAYLCDSKVRRELSERGDDPDTLGHIYADLINEWIRDRPADMVVAVHVCRGNFRGNWAAEGGYEPIARTMFERLNVDAYFLEYDDARSGGFEPLRFVPSGKIVVLGLVTSKRPDLESKDTLKRRIEEATRYVPLERLALSPQCGFSSTHHGNPLTEAEQDAKLRLTVEVAREIWGDL